LKDGDNNVIAVIGDGAMSAGMAYEAMNNAGHLGSRLIVILNDNDMSIAPPVGRDERLSRQAGLRPDLPVLRDAAKSIAKTFPSTGRESRPRGGICRGFWTGGTLFEELGFYYVGPVDGHNLEHLLPILKNVRDTHNGPVLIHASPRRARAMRRRKARKTSITALPSSTSSPASRPNRRPMRRATPMCSRRP
jgi:1-deoxy-D-xylulose-5-phosphate synthase